VIDISMHGDDMRAAAHLGRLHGYQGGHALLLVEGLAALGPQRRDFLSGEQGKSEAWDNCYEWRASESKGLTFFISSSSA
jgi:hypothetical protein